MEIQYFRRTERVDEEEFGGLKELILDRLEL